MATKLIVPVVKIEDVRSHPNASMLGLARILFYQVVVGLVEDPDGQVVRHFVKGMVDEKGKRVPLFGGIDQYSFWTEDRDGNKSFVNAEDVEMVRFSYRYKDGDLVVYIPGDSIITDEWATKLDVKSLLKGGNRVSKIALRGEPSFGLVVAIPDDKKGIWQEGDNVAEYFGITKYEPPVKTNCGDAAPRDAEIDPYFDKFTDIQNGRIFTTIFQPGEEVVASEKFHGCLHADTRVMLANGEEIPIASIVKGDIVLAYNGSGEFVPRKVTNVVHRNPDLSQRWLKLDFGERSIVCTGDHLFMTENRGWVAACELSEKDEVAQGF